MATENAASVTDANPPVNKGSGEDREMIAKLTTDPKAGDFVVVGDKHYTPAEIKALLRAQEEAGNTDKATKAELEKTKAIFKRIYSNPENPDRGALKEALILAGRSADEADAEIATALGDGTETETETPSSPDKKKKVAAEKTEEAKPSLGDRGTKAWIRSTFNSITEKVVTGNADLKKYIDAVGSEETDEKVKAERSDFRTNEILGSVRTRVDRILRERIRTQGEAAFWEDPEGWFTDAAKSAVTEEVTTARKRYGDPNRMGITPGGRSPDPVAAWVTENKEKKQGRFDPKKAPSESYQEFATSLTAALLGDYSSGKARA